MRKWRYGVILDAGSSGTRLHVYRWLKNSKARKEASVTELQQLPIIKTKKTWTKKVKPGISTFANRPDEVGPEHLEELFRHALDIIPKDDVKQTPIFLLATAGMRLLENRPRKELLHEICSYARKATDFQLSDCDSHIQVIPGDTEGLYGWVATNYLLGGFNNPQDHQHGKSHHTYGFLDMGGASAQIAFAPNATEAEKHADDLKLLRLRTLDGLAAEYRLFVASWLGYGVNEARRRYLEDLANSMGTAKTGELPDPCLPAGLRMDMSYNNPRKGAHLVGTGKFSECLSRTYPLLGKEAQCDDPPCLFNGIHVPAIDFDVNHFVGVSEYWHTTHEIFEMGHTDKAYDFQTYQARVTDFCSQDWKDIQVGIEGQKYGDKVDEERVRDVCFKASWMINMLHDGIGIPRVGLEQGSKTNPDQNATTQLLDKAKQEGYLEPFQAVNKIDTTEVSWTLGKMVLYASSQIPPATGDVLAVGFGSNTADMPIDFQFANGNTTSDPLNTPPSTAIDAETPHSNSILSTSNLPRRTPGFILILLILVVVIVLLLGRDRRAALFRTLTFRSSSGRRNIPFLSSIRSPSAGKYARLSAAEEGAVPHPSAFELDNISSRSSDSSSTDSDGARRKRGVRRGTPRMASPALGDAAVGQDAAFGNVNSGMGLGLGLEGEASGLRSGRSSPGRRRGGKGSVV